MKECCKVENVHVEIPKIIRDEVAKKGGLCEIVKSLSEKDAATLTHIIKALADEKRLKILFALGHQRMCVCMLAELTKCPYSKCSYHIAKLRDMGFIKPKQFDTYIIYSLTVRGKQILKYLKKIKEMKT